MTLLELSVEYRDHARALDFRIVQLRDAWEHTMDEGERCMLAERIRVLSTMLREPGNWQCSVSATTTGGTGEMSNTRYRRGKLYAADMAVYTRQMAADNSAELSRLKRNLIRA